VKIWSIATAVVTAVIVAAGGPRAEAAPVRMGVVLNALDNPFFLAIYEGTRVEASRLGVRATVRSVTSNADLDGQAEQVRKLVKGRSDCYVVNPITATNLIGALRGARRPIVNVDSPLDPAAARRAGVHVSTYIGTDDFAAGRLAGRRMAALLPRGGEVALVGGLVNNVNSGVRLRGFERGIGGSRLKVAARVNADYDRTKAEIAAERILRAHPRLAGFFAASDNMALGIADALRAAGRTGRVKVVGLDGIADALDAIRTGTLDATVSQYPYVMGRMAVEACAAAARRLQLPQRVDAPLALLTKENVDRAIAAFPSPFEQYSDPLRDLLRRRG
jgi:ABC-type sugar transport system substrate-binding protein